VNSAPITPVSPIMVPARINPIAPVAPRRENAADIAQRMKAATPEGVGRNLDISA
jgi:hypothetical protein